VEMKAVLSFALVALAFSRVLSQQPPEKSKTVESIISEISKSNLKALDEKLVGFGTRHTMSDTASDTRGIGAARRWIKSEFEKAAKQSNGRMTFEFQEGMSPVSLRTPRATKIVNVVATLRPPQNFPGSDRIFLVGGHYDSRATDVNDAESDAPGANDDGSGATAVIELARVFSRFDFRATIVFVTFAGEEQGLYGSTQWAEMAKRKGLRIEGVLNNDMIGNSTCGDGSVQDKYVRLYAEGLTPLDTGKALQRMDFLGLENDGPSRTLARYVQETGERYVPGHGVKMIYLRDRFLRGGDQSPFHDLGFAAVRLVDARENYDHQHQDVRKENGKQYGDLPEFMNFDYLAKNVKVDAAALASLALAPTAPKNVGVVVSGLAYDTRLRWNKNPESDLAGYYVRYRETISPQWEGKVFTADTTIDLKFLKDEYLFGVQAVDKEGNASLVSLPLPVR
jgi:Zn-dependent M28 family amino/carboxypeptidase